MFKIPVEVNALASNEFKGSCCPVRAAVFSRCSAYAVVGGRIMSGFQGLKQEFLTEPGLDIMKGHWLKVIQVWTFGFLAGVMTDTGSGLISDSGM